MTKRDIKALGYDRGWCIASWIDLPEVGTDIKPFNIPNFIGTIETVSDAGEVFTELASEAESNSRQYSPFEDTANELNDLWEVKPYDVWDLFEESIQAGILANWRSRKSFYKGVKRHV